MQLSENGLKHLIEAEGVRNKMYLDTKGLPTIGVGTLIDTPEEQWMLTATLTDEQVYSLLRKELVRFEKAVNDGVKVEITQNMYDALISISYNIGVAGFLNSTFLKRINAKESDERIKSAIMMWTKNKELIGRRKKEVELFFS